MNESDIAAGFDADRLDRRLERERRLKEIELSFQNIAEESKQKQNDILTKVFTEEGQKKMMEDHDDAGGVEGGANNNIMHNVNLQDNSYRYDQEEPSSPTSAKKAGMNKIFPRIAEMVTPKKPKRTKQNSQTFQPSPNGVASFPDIDPLSSPSPPQLQKKKKKKNDPNSSYSMRKDGPGLAGRVSNARVQDTIIHSFFKVRRNCRKIIIGVLLVAALITITVTLFDIKSSSDSVHVEDWDTLREVQSVLISQDVDRRKFIHRKSDHFKALAWLANDEVNRQFDDTDASKMSSNRVLLERFVMAVFYYSTNHNDDEDYKWKVDWQLDHGDKANTSVCDWHGVDCLEIETDANNDEGNKVEKFVKSLDLTKNNLSGTITDEISKLEHLTSFILSNNMLQGTVPSSIGQLHQLETLKVGENQLTGEISDSICALKTWKLTILASDCGGADGDIVCSCCTDCSP